MIFNYTQQYWLTSSITGELLYDVNGYPSMSGEETQFSFTASLPSKYEAVKPVAAVNVGIGSSTVGAFSTAQGSGSVSNGAYSYALGDKVTTKGTGSISIGKETVTSGSYSLAVGQNVITRGDSSLASGKGTIASGSNSMAAGSGSKAEGVNSVAFGKGTIAKTDEQVVIGKYNTEDTQSLFVVGAGTNDANRKTIMKVDTVGARIDGSMTISGSSTFTNIGPAVFSGSIVQAENTATGINALGFGLYNTATGDYSVTHGKNNTVLGYGAAAFGDSNLASGDHVLIHGAASKATADYSFASGLSVSSSGQYQHVIGKYNIPSTTQAAFIIGNGGNNSSRSNLLVAVGDVVQVTGSLNVNGNAIANSFTGSLLGDVIGTSSFANTASFVNTLNQNVTISGSLNVSGSILPSNRKLYYSDGTVSVDWEASETYDSHGNYKSIEWDNRILRDTSGVTASIDWGGRRLHDSNGTRRLIWNTSGVQVSGSLNVTGSVIAPSFTGSLRGHVVTSSIDTSQYKLFNSVLVSAVDWENGIIGHPDTRSIQWINRQLIDGSNNVSIAWSDRQIYTPAGYRALNYGGDDHSRSDIYHRQNNRINMQEAFSANDLSFSGHAIEASIDGSSNVGELVYLETDGTWYPVDQTTSTSAKMLGINVDDGYVLLDGDVIIKNQIQDPNYGLPVYIRHGGTTLSTNIPTSGFVRVVGHCYYQNQSSGAWIVKFRPSNDWYEI